MRVVFLLKPKPLTFVGSFVLRALNKKALIDGDFYGGAAASGW